MNNKILTFIYDKEKNKFLSLNTEKHSEHAPQGGWFTVTGNIKNSELPEDAVRREIKEKTGIIAKDIFSLDWGSIYEFEKEEFKEMSFLAFIDPKKIVLSKDLSEYQWLSIDEFIKKIEWNDNRILLKKVLEKGVNKKAFFDKKERGE